MDYFLTKYNHMCALIAECHTLSRARELHDKTTALAEYERLAKNHLAERQLGVIRLRAARKGGQILIEMAQRGERATRGGDKRWHPKSDTTTLDKLGLTKQQSSEWQQLAKIASERFEQALKIALKSDYALLTPMSVVNLAASLCGETLSAAKFWKDASMPEFHQENLMPKRTIHVHFESDEEVGSFAKLIGQKIGPRTKTIWFPEKPKTIVQ